MSYCKLQLIHFYRQEPVTFAQTKIREKEVTTMINGMTKVFNFEYVVSYAVTSGDICEA